MDLRDPISVAILAGALVSSAAAAQDAGCQQSIGQLERQFKEAPQAALLLQLADCRRRMGEFAAAATLYAKFLTLYPEDAHGPEAREQLVRAEREDRRQRKAARALREKEARAEPAPVPPEPKAAAAAPPPVTVPEPVARAVPVQVAPPVPPVSNALLAVLEIRNHQADKELAGYFSDRVRTRSLDAVPGLRVMTRENAQVLLEGKKLEDCEGECDVETGRHIGADLVVSGDLRMIGSNYKLDLRLHDVRSGLLLSGAQAQGKTIDDLDASVAQAVTTLLEPTRHLPPTSGAVRGEPEKPVEAKPRPAPPPEAWLAPAPLPDLPKEAPLLAERPAVKLAPAPPPTAPAAATEPAGQTAPAPAAERSRTWTWVAGGAAMAALGAGGAFGLKSRSTSAAITGTTDHTGRDVDSLRDQYQSQAHAANVLFAVGAGFAALSAGFFILSF